jgi:hypothetical protein
MRAKRREFKHAGLISVEAGQGIFSAARFAPARATMVSAAGRKTKPPEPRLNADPEKEKVRLDAPHPTAQQALPRGAKKNAGKSQVGGGFLTSLTSASVPATRNP